MQGHNICVKLRNPLEKNSKPPLNFHFFNIQLLPEFFQAGVWVRIPPAKVEHFVFRRPHHDVDIHAFGKCIRRIAEDSAQPLKSVKTIGIIDPAIFIKATIRAFDKNGTVAEAEAHG